MIRYRCFDNLEKKFIYPVLDVTNDFYSGQYTPDRYTFDRLLYEKDGVEYYENDIVIKNYLYTNKKSSGKTLSIMCLVRSYDNFERCEWFCQRVFNLTKHHNHQTYHNQWKYRTTIGDHWDAVIRNVGNLHINQNLLTEEYEQKYQI